MKNSPMPPRTKPMRKRRAKAVQSVTGLRELANGQPCLVRLPGVCNGDPAKTILAHYRLSGLCGMGLKPHDLIGAWACNACHDECDRRTRILETDFVRRAHAEAVMRTQNELLAMGKI